MGSATSDAMTGNEIQEARETMGAHSNSMARVRRALMLAFAVFATMVMLVPAGAEARKIANPSPPDFFGELTGGFLQLSGAGGTKIFQLSLDFESLGVAKPSFRGTIDSAGNINVPQAQLVFPPLNFAIGTDTVNVTLLPTAPATGRIDPLTGRVDFRVRLRIQATGAAQGVSLGGSCFVGSASQPIDINGTTHNGTFPDVSGGLYVADFLPNPAEGFAGGLLPAGPYSDEEGVWEDGPRVGGVGYNFKPRVAGSFRIANETLTATGASGCGPLGLANGPINDQLGLPSDPGASTAVLEFAFVAGGSRPPSNAIVQKGVKSNFIAPGVSTSTWPSTEVPELPTTVPATIDASSSVFTAGPNPGGRYSFDLGTGSYGGFTDTAVQPINFATPGLRTIRVQARDVDGDIDTKTRQLLVVPSTDIGVSHSAVGGSFRGGSPGALSVAVSNVSSSRPNTQPVTVSSTLPTGVTYTGAVTPPGWNCSYSAPDVSCTLPTGQLAAGSTQNLTLNVNVAPGAANPLSSTVTATQAGDPVSDNNSSTISIPVTKTDLTVDLSHTGDVVANGAVTYAVNVQNVGDAGTSGDTVVNVTLPPEMTYRSSGSGGPGWACVSGATPQDVTCTRTAAIGAGQSAPPFSIRARVSRLASGTISASATVTGQGDTDAFGGANTDTDPTTILIEPDLALDVSTSGDFIVGDPGPVTFTATNESVVPIGAPTTVSTSLPAGLTVTSVSGSGWDCGATTIGGSSISCDYTAGLAPLETTPNLVAQLAVDHPAYPGVQIDAALANTADAYDENDTDSQAVTVRRLDVSMTKSAVRSFTVGIEGQYRLSVSNLGDAATVGPVRVLDTLPPQLRLNSVSGGGWNCSASTPGGQQIDCTLNSAIAAGSSAANLNVRVTVLDAAAEAGEVTNVATVDTERDDRGVTADSPVNGNNTDDEVTKAVSVDLSIEGTHGATFRTGTVQTYSLKIRNVGFFPTVPGAPVDVVDDLPAGMVPQMADIWTDRSGWTCTDLNEGTVAAPDHKVTCELPAPSPSGSAILKGGTATIEIPVEVRDPAVNPSLNVAEVSTEKDNSVDRSPNNRSVDSTAVSRIDLATTASQSIAPRAGSIGEVSVDVVNDGNNDTVEPTVVTIPLASSTSYRPTGSTLTGWQCTSAGSGTSVVCTRLAAIAAGTSAPPLKVRMNVSPSAPATWTTNVTVRSSGELAERLGNNDVSVPATLEKIDLRMVKTVVPASIKAGARGQYTLAVQNIGNTPSAGTTTVTESVSSAFTNVTASGPGWSCQVNGQDVACTRTSPVTAGSTTPVITVAFDVPLTSAGTRNTVATVSNPSDPYPVNNTADGPTTIIASADVTIAIDQPPAMRVGDTASVTYRVRNVGSDATSGSPSVRLKIEMPSSLEPVGTSSGAPWNCTESQAAGNQNASFECLLGTQLPAGQSSVLNAQVRVLPTTDTETGTLARVSSPSDINPSNNVASATSSVTGIDLSASVAPVALPAPVGTDLEAGVTARRVVTVSNQGTAATVSPVRVEVPMPDGVQWIDSPGVSPGWSCAMPVRTVVCTAAIASLAPGASAPPLNIEIQPSKSNAPAVSLDYTVKTLNDGNPDNDTATRNDTVVFKPTATITAAPSGTTTSTSASITFSSDDPAATFECKLDLGPFQACSSPYELTALSLGGHSVQIRAINSRGMQSVSPAEANWTVIAEEPSGEGTGIEATLTGGTLSLAALGEVPLPGGQLKLTGKRFPETGVWSIPQAGVRFDAIEQTIDAPGVGLVTVKIRISATGPGVGSLPTGGGPASMNLPMQAKLEARLGDVPLIGPDADCFLRPITFDLNGTYDEAGQTVTLGSPGLTFPQVSAGCGALGGTVNDLLELPRSDIALSLDFSLEQIGPVDDVKPLPPSITAGPSGRVNTTAAAFSFEGEPGNTFECRLDAGDWGACTSPKPYTGLAEGAHTFEVRQTNAASKTSDPASRSWTVDTTAPGAPQISSGPSGTVPASNATFAFTGEADAAFDCSLDNGPWERCSAPKSYQSLRDGARSFRVRQTDAAGNVGSAFASRSWEIASTQSRLEATLTGGSLSLAALGEVALPGGQLKLVGQRGGDGSWTVPQSGVQFNPIEQTIDAPGIGAVTVKISITATADAVGSLPAGGGSATFNLPAQAKLEARLGNIVLIGPDADCALRPVVFDLAGTYDQGAKTVALNSPSVSFPQVSAGCGPLGGTVNTLLELPRNDIAISLNFSLEEFGAIDAPQIASGPTGTVNSPNASFSFTGTNGATFECRIDNGPWAACTSPRSYTNLANGQHVFEVRQILEGSTSEAATRTWTVQAEPKVALTVKAPKKLKPGASLTMKVQVRNTGKRSADTVKVCVKSPTKFVTGAASRCVNVKNVAAGKSKTATFKLKTKKGKKGEAKFQVSAEYLKPGDTNKIKELKGHVTLIK